ncbi:cyclase family protein [Cohnella rhizosphaerae]|uniref:Cyclase family protein n=1 Tax=Cohnella rhizosphaerae TaxID=1457232 RepID=A0A9X4KV02_9BACL|nr:cyclase family protein [Cohnella rhizosphaerae]MDG0811624.1 cyclase family protein [Cohnella rhizosphaerae]
MTRRLIDLSMDIYHGAPTFAFDPKCAVIVHNTVDTIGYNISQLSMSTHQGTHLDAPFHFLNEGNTVDRLDLNRCIGEALLVDLSHKRPKEPIGVADFAPYADRIGEGTRLVYRTDWHLQYPRKHYFSDFPYMTLELAEWLADRRIALIGMDVPTPNPTDFDPVHKTLLRAEIVIVEGLANLGAIGRDEFFLMAAPLKIAGRDGAPIRAVGMVDDGGETGLAEKKASGENAAQSSHDEAGEEARS